MPVSLLAFVEVVSSGVSFGVLCLLSLEAFLNFSSKNTLRKEKKKILFYLGCFWLKNFDNIQAFFYLIALEKFIKNIKIVFTPNIRCRLDTRLK